MINVPFPQANNAELLHRIVIDMNDNGISCSEIEEKHKIVRRQAKYYLDALRFLELVMKQKQRYFLTIQGVNIRTMPKGFSKLAFAINALNIPFLNSLYVEYDRIKDLNEMKRALAIRIMEKELIGYRTALRRAETMKSWFSWFDELKESR